MILYRRLIVFLFSLHGFFSSFAQQKEPKIEVLITQVKNEVRLRWAANTPSAWMKLNKYGYSLERITVSRNGNRLQAPKIEILNSTPIKPEPLELWEELANKNDYAAILAQSLYGDSFTVEGSNNQDGLLQIINKAREVEQRFAFGLFAADMSFEAAVKAGLGFVDKNIVKGEEYLYRIKSLVPENILNIKGGNILITIKDTPRELQKPLDLFSKGDDKSILITWEYELFKNLYVAYFIERSENGKLFKRLNEQPLINMNTNKGGESNKRMTFIDSIPQNNKIYHYRVIGITSFGEESPPSEVTKSQGFKRLEEIPRISRHNLNKTGGVELIWEFKKSAEDQITSFKIDRAPKVRGPYKTVKENISPQKRSITLEDIEPSNYYTISAIGQNNQKTTSLTAFVQTIDSIPPAPPVGLKAEVDTLGIVKLNWQANLEKDLSGYRVFRANIATEEYAQLTKIPISNNSYTDSVQLKSLNSKVFYKIVAEDKRYNLSDFSAPLTVKKPDVVPPASPVFSAYKVLTNGVDLSWIPSNSEDVVKHQLFRKNLGGNQGDWQLVYSTSNTHKYTDVELKTGKRYRYAIFAEDDSGLVSKATTPITITAKGGEETPKLIKRVNGVADRVNKKIDLSWNVIGKVNEVLIYKHKNEEKPVLFRQINSNIKTIKDTKVNPGNKYMYTFKVLDNLGNTEFKKIEVTY